MGSGAWLAGHKLGACPGCNVPGNVQIGGKFLRWEMFVETVQVEGGIYLCLCVCLGLQLTYFTWLITAGINNMSSPVPPPHLKLRPYGGTEMCIVLLLLLRLR